MSFVDEDAPPLDLRLLAGETGRDGLIFWAEHDLVSDALGQYRMNIWKHRDIPGLTIISTRPNATNLSHVEIDYQHERDDSSSLHVYSTALAAVSGPDDHPDPHVSIFKDLFIDTLKTHLRERRALGPQVRAALDGLRAGGLYGYYEFLKVPDEQCAEQTVSYRSGTQFAGMTKTSSILHGRSSNEKSAARSSRSTPTSGLRTENFSATHMNGAWSWRIANEAPPAPRTDYRRCLQ